MMAQSEEAYRIMLTEYPDLLTAKQVGQILGVDRHSVYKLIDYGDLYGIKVVGSYRVSKLNLIEFLIGENVS